MHVNEIVTNKIIEQLEKGVVPWNKPWFSGMPYNPITKTVYSGINPWLLNITSELNGYKSNIWLTQNQFTNLGGRVDKDIYFNKTKTGFCIFFSMIEKNKHKKNKTKEEREQDTYRLLKFYKVYNLDTITGLPEDKVNQWTHGKLEGDIPQAEEVIKNYAIEYRQGGNQAYYSPKDDYIQIPNKDNFKNLEGYYSTIFHEMTHSTGHESRLNRFKKDEAVNFGSQDYSKEELVAELGSSFLMNHCQLDHIDQGTAYIQSWLKPLKNDPSFIISASSKAQKAFDLIIGINEQL